MKQHLAIIRGTTERFAITIRDEDDVLYTMGEYEAMKFGVKADPEDTEYLIQITIPTGSENEDGAYEFTITPDQTENLELGHYYYDIGLQSGDNYYNVVECSNFVLKPNITKRTV